ncbi:DapH/DapD/GlmU-related protein [Chryseobacterium jejuense]|uniref:Bifunctional protein GlmU n=1 Tax=Chryseobacterium jejuense TaxID=445960 RepID=A0A2X2VR08_CHRJE|nr:DapH/DapD/GlmU-related protein [Chryseobacterium jejuense]SDI83469.1 Hexapeptide repeat of succinyl-transferase [Chryseobacterium jejuense]SQB27673.1 Bifunctional protein GlmU [Chryseobacterium jejuense]
MINISHFINSFSSFISDKTIQPWEAIDNLDNILKDQLENVTADFVTTESCTIHPTAIVEQNVTFKGRIIIDEGAFIGANAYIRGPVYIGKNVKIGPGSEIKQSMIFEETAVAHFNYIGNSIIGSRVNFEAGSICANHYNERKDKEISVLFNAEIIKTGIQKFGSLVGDDSKIGANAVLSPGTILVRESIVKRLELVEQLP